jgi:Flp pilus assembly protein TadD
VALLQDSAAKLPDNPSVHYHLGMAYTKVGDKEAARKALTAATAMNRPFREQADAKRALAELN